MIQVRFHDLAAVELTDVYRWYEERDAAIAGMPFKNWSMCYEGFNRPVRARRPEADQATHLGMRPPEGQMGPFCVCKGGARGLT